MADLVTLSALSSEPDISTSCQQWLEQTAPPTSMLILVHKVLAMHFHARLNGWFRLELLMFFIAIPRATNPGNPPRFH